MRKSGNRFFAGILLSIRGRLRDGAGPIPIVREADDEWLDP